MWSWTISYGLAFDDFSCCARGQLFTPVRLQNQGGCDRQSLRSGQKCISKSWEPGEKQAAGNGSVWGGYTPKQAGLQVPPSLHCHMDGFKAEPVTIATAPTRAASHQDAAPEEGKEQGWPTSALTPPVAQSPVPGQLCNAQASFPYKQEGQELFTQAPSESWISWTASPDLKQCSTDFWIPTKLKDTELNFVVLWDRSEDRRTCKSILSRKEQRHPPFLTYFQTSAFLSPCTCLSVLLLATTASSLLLFVLTLPSSAPVKSSAL